MHCHVCGARMEAVLTTLPFKVRDRTMVMVKGGTNEAMRQLQ
jgi:hypothetical protein